MHVAHAPLLSPGKVHFIIQTSQWLWGSVSLKMPFTSTLGGQFRSEVGQTDIVFGERSGFISRGAPARLQVSVCIGYDPG